MSVAAEPKVEAHQQAEVDAATRQLREVFPRAQALLRQRKLAVICRKVPDDFTVPTDADGAAAGAASTAEPQADLSTLPSAEKHDELLQNRKVLGRLKVHFIRHGEGDHNVVQREWRARADWDGQSEPYTPDNDPEFKFIDALLTEKGEQQALDLRARVAAIVAASGAADISQPFLLVVSPLRRATQTGLIGFGLMEPPKLAAAGKHIPGSSTSVSTAAVVKALCREECHEQCGKHTCDKRLSKGELQKAFPEVDYSELAAEEDPLWGDGNGRESFEGIAARGVDFAQDCLYKYAVWAGRDQVSGVAVAAHSAFLLTFFNAVLVVSGEEEPHVRGWFGTGEMRTVELTFVEAAEGS